MPLFIASKGDQQKILSLVGGSPNISLGKKRKRNVSRGGGSSTSVSIYWKASFGSEGSGVYETWAVDADVSPVAPLTEIRPEVIPDILYAVNGRASNKHLTLFDIELGLSNYGPDEAIEPDPETFERTLAVDDTHYYWVKFTDAYGADLGYDIQPVTTTEPDVTTAPNGEVWKILWEVKATSETYTEDTVSPRTGTKYTITQINEGEFEFILPAGDKVVRLTDAISGTGNSEYKGFLQEGPSDLTDIGSTELDKVVVKTIINPMGGALAVGSDAYYWVQEDTETSDYYVKNLTLFQ